MNKVAIISIPLSLMLVACGTIGDTGTTTSSMNGGPEPTYTFPNECEVKTFYNDCDGPNPQPPHITLNLNGHNAEPRKYCAEPGETVEFHVLPNPTGSATATVGTLPKDGTSLWLIGTNHPDSGIFTITIPLNATGDNDYYLIFADGHCVDPRISITDGDS